MRIELPFEHHYQPESIRNFIYHSSILNTEIIRIIEGIVKPYFNFEMDDFYGDRGGVPYPKIEQLKILYFKKNGKDRKLVISKKEEHVLLEKIKALNIGYVKIIQFPYIGRFICVKL